MTPDYIVPAKVHPYAQPGPANGRGLVVSSGVARDIIARADELASKRSEFEAMWRECADYCLPMASRDMSMAGAASASYDVLADGPSSRVSARKRYDSTAIHAVDRLAAGMESLVTPQSEQWHGLDIDDAIATEASDTEKAYFEKLTKAQFRFRYDSRSGFVSANQKAIRGAIALGTSVNFIEESYGTFDRDHRRTPFYYSNRPLSECLLDVNAQDEHDTCYRRFRRSARQLVQRFGEDNVSQKVRDAASAEGKQDEQFEIIHAVAPRVESGGRANTNRKAPYSSFYVEVEGAHLIGESGFYEFPFAIYTWLRNTHSPYGEGPVMMILDDIRGQNVIVKGALASMQQYVKPPMAVAHDGVMNRPNLNPGALNYGAVDGNGRPKIMPIITAQNPAFAREIIADGKVNINEGLYVNLFQILIQNPQMTATEAMLRANEKGELLGPAGSNIQTPLATTVNREIGILDRKGAFDQGASLELPDSLSGRPFGARMTSPLDRLRRAKEASGIMIAYQSAGQVASVTGNVGIFDNFNDDEAIKVIAEANGSPASIQRTKEEVDAIRQARQEVQEAAQNAAAAESAAKTAKDAMPAVAQGLALAQGQGPSTAPLQLPQIAPGGPA